MTQNDLGKELGFSRNYINMLIKGSRKMNYLTNG